MMRAYRITRTTRPYGSAEVDERQVALDLLQRRRGRVALGGLELLDRERPLDPHVGVVVLDPALGGVGVVAVLLVEDVSDLGEHAEAVGEPDGDVEHARALVGELEALPLPEGRRAPADVDDRVAPAADELRRAAVDLEMHAAHDPVARARVVVLDHLLLDPQAHERAAPVGLDEEAALVAEHLGLDEDGSVQPCLEALHRPGTLAGARATAPETSGGCGMI